jgi:hypothetical protein
MINRWIVRGIAAFTVSLCVPSFSTAQDCSTGDCGGVASNDAIIGGDGYVESGSYAGSGSYVGDLAPSEAIQYGARRGFGNSDLFYNYYTQGNANSANAQMYLSPIPVPPNVGHTFYTYQPFYPHHMLYWHKDRYHNYYDGGRGMNRTRAVYYAPPVRTAVQNLYWNYLRLPR